jgi:hypothetical protein
MNSAENRRYHLLLKECGITNEDDKKTLVAAWSDGRTTSSTELTPVETTAMLRHLQNEHSKLCKPMRGKVIHYLCLLGYVIPGTKEADFDKINRFIVDMGSNNPRRVILNYLYYSELPAVVSQVEVMYKNETNRLNK